jgi:hypothetical protein
MQAFHEGSPKEVLRIGWKVGVAPIISLTDLAMDAALFLLVLDTLRRVLDCITNFPHIVNELPNLTGKVGGPFVA